MLALLIGLQFYLKLQARWLGPCPCHSLYHLRGGTCVLSSPLNELNSPESGSSFCHPLGTLRVTPCLQSPSTAMEITTLTPIIVCAAGRFLTLSPCCQPATEAPERLMAQHSQISKQLHLRILQKILHLDLATGPCPGLST